VIAWSTCRAPTLARSRAKARRRCTFCLLRDSPTSTKQCSAIAEVARCGGLLDRPMLLRRADEAPTLRIEASAEARGVRSSRDTKRQDIVPSVDHALLRPRALSALARQRFVVSVPQLAEPATRQAKETLLQGRALEPRHHTDSSAAVGPGQRGGPRVLESADGLRSKPVTRRGSPLSCGEGGNDY
jgi:hypothetical protein